MRALFKALSLPLIVFQIDFLLSYGDRIEMCIYPETNLRSIIPYLAQGDVVELDFCEFSDAEKSFSILVSPIPPSPTLPSATSKVVHIEVNIDLYRESDFYVCKLLELVECLHENGYRMYLHNLNTYIFVDGDILQIGTHEFGKEGHEKSNKSNDRQMIRLATAIKSYVKISTLMLNECSIRVDPTFAIELLRSIGWKISVTH